MLQIQDLQKTKAAFSGDVSVFWAFDPSRYFFHSYLHTCVNKDNKDVQMHHHASLPEAVQPALFFKTSAKAKLLALAWAQLQPMAAVGILQPAKW